MVITLLCLSHLTDSFTVVKLFTCFSCLDGLILIRGCVLSQSWFQPIGSFSTSYINYMCTVQ